MFLSELPGYWFVVDRKSPYCKTGVTISKTRVWLDMAIFRDDGHENEGLRLLHMDKFFNHWMTSLEHISDTMMSWHHWPKTNVKVWWTICMNELSIRLPNPNSHGHGVKDVSCSRATCYQKETLLTFPKFSPIICQPVPIYFLTSLRRITFSWSIIQPFGRIQYRYLII